MLPPFIRDDVAGLLETDKVFRKSGVAMPDFSWRTHEEIFPALMRTIVGQQLSTKAASSIWARVADGVGDVSSPVAFSCCDDETLRGYGLSRQKISYLRGLCAAVYEKRFSPDSLRSMRDDDIIAAITALKGFGVWSAQMILIFTLARPDIWPSGDLGIREGVKLYRSSAERPTVAETEIFGEKFKGRRTAAALLLWKMKDAE